MVNETKFLVWKSIIQSTKPPLLYHLQILRKFFQRFRSSEILLQCKPSYHLTIIWMHFHFNWARQPKHGKAEQRRFQLKSRAPAPLFRVSPPPMWFVWQYVAAIAGWFRGVYDGKCLGAERPSIHPSIYRQLQLMSCALAKWNEENKWKRAAGGQESPADWSGFSEEFWVHFSNLYLNYSEDHWWLTIYSRTANKARYLDCLGSQCT